MTTWVVYGCIEKGGRRKEFGALRFWHHEMSYLHHSQSHLIYLHSRTLGCLALVSTFNDYVGGGDSAMTERHYKINAFAFHACFLYCSPNCSALARIVVDSDSVMIWEVWTIVLLLWVIRFVTQCSRSAITPMHDGMPTLSKVIGIMNWRSKGSRSTLVSRIDVLPRGWKRSRKQLIHNIEVSEVGNQLKLKH